MKEKIILLDSSGVLHRCFHGYPPAFANFDGQSHNIAAVYGYCEYIRHLSQEFDYDYLIHVLDPEGGSEHRKNLYPLYKANRLPTDPVLSYQKKILPSVLSYFNQTCICQEGVESDDILGVLARKFAREGKEVLVLTKDKDLLQLVKDGEIVVAQYTKDSEGHRIHQFFEEQDVVDKLGVRPDQVADYLALIGDVSDNIPGVAKVGPKKASMLLQEYGSLSNLITHAHDIQGTIGQNLRASIENKQLYLSRQLTTLLETVQIQLSSSWRPIPGVENREILRQKMKIPSYWPENLEDKNSISTKLKM